MKERILFYLETIFLKITAYAKSLSIKKRILLYGCVVALYGAIICLVLMHKISKLEFLPEPKEVVFYIEKFTVDNADIFYRIPERIKLSEEDRSGILKSVFAGMGPSRIMERGFVEILHFNGGDWKVFWYYPRKGADYYKIKKNKNDNSFECVKLMLPVETETKKVHRKIDDSIWGSMADAQVPPGIIEKFSDIFSWQIDFLTDPIKSDEYKIIYEIEKVAKKNEQISSRIIAAQYKAARKTYNAFYFTNRDGMSGYFDTEGKSLRNAFLKAPLQFTRISSHFSTARWHPIFKLVRPHLGIDYAAPEGTPVLAIGDGMAVFVGKSGGFGNLVRIKHPSGYETWSGHLSRFAKDLRKGVWVKQGQVIGYVGMTGDATGPHLDFRIKKDDKFLNFLNMEQPPGSELYGEDKKDLEEMIRGTRINGLSFVLGF